MTAPRRLSDALAERIRKYRVERGWSFPRLAEECETLGAPQLTAASLTNIERGRTEDAKRKRRDLSVDEVAVLAKALGVPPVLLLFPLGATESVELLPGREVPTWDALKWWAGEILLDPSDENDAALDLAVFRDHDDRVRESLLLRSAREANALDPAEYKRQIGPVDQRLLDLRRTMRRMRVTPPDLPARLWWILRQENAGDDIPDADDGKASP